MKCGVWMMRVRYDSRGYRYLMAWRRSTLVDGDGRMWVSFRPSNWGDARVNGSTISGRSTITVERANPIMRADLQGVTGRFDPTDPSRTFIKPFASIGHGGMRRLLSAFDCTDLMPIVRRVMAGRCDPHVMFGWIEDNAPEPWSLLSTPDPVAFFRVENES